MLFLLACSPIPTHTPFDSADSTPFVEETGGDTGDTEETGDTQDTQDTQDTNDPEVDYSKPGDDRVSTRGATVQTSCAMGITFYEPETAGDTVVILSHGFARAPDNMVGWAEHLASHGLTVVTPTLCHASIWDADHAQNGADLADLSGQLGFANTVYVGHSAGGLASVLAAEVDPSAVGVIGLDLTDADDLAKNANLGSLPAYGLLGEPSQCNSEGNGETIYPEPFRFRVTEADHCDFESPTDWVCELGCPGTNDQFTNEEIQAAITGLLTSAAVDLAGTGSAEAWWSQGGTFHDELASQGLID